MASANLIIGYNNYASRAGTTITRGQQNTSYPATNTTNDQRGMIWKTANATPDANKWVAYDFGSALPIDLITIFDLNTQDDATAVIASGTGYSLGTTTFRNLTPAGATAHIAQRSLSFHTPQGLPLTKQTCKLLLNVAPAVDSTLNAGKVFIGSALQFVKNWSYPATYSPVDLSTDFATIHAATGGKRRPKRNGGTFSVPYVPLAGQQNIQTIVDTVGTHTPVVLIFDRDNSYGRRTFYARFTKAPTFQREASETYSYVFEWQEEI